MRARQEFLAYLMAAHPRWEWEVREIYIPIRPMGKERARENYRTPTRTRQWEDYVASVAAYDLDSMPAIDFPVAAKLIFGIYKNKADTDNMEKIVWDALQRGDSSGRNRVLTNDKFVRQHIEKVEVEVEKGEEFFWVRFYALNDRDYERYTRNCDDTAIYDLGF